ncbi:MAG: MarR family transcriptional regulator [Gammaproteobacteria bacterium]|nr:MarR family transcriptional regulator [Gammaproteobacteria bacterium]
MNTKPIMDATLTRRLTLEKTGLEKTDLRKTDSTRSASLASVAIDRTNANVLSNIDWERNPGFLVLDLKRLISQAVDAGIQGFDLTSAQLRAVFQLIRKDGVSQVALADVMGIKKAATGVLLERLEEKGLIERRPDAIDRRANLIFLSDKALELVIPLVDSGNSILKNLMRGIKRQEQGLLVDLLLQMKCNAERMIEEGKENNG